MPRRDPRRELLRDVLRDVSRSFYLTLRVLPGPIRDQIGTAYLLARATDTIADTDALPVEQRLEALNQLRAAILDEQQLAPIFTPFAEGQSSAGERRLLERIPDVLQVCSGFEIFDRDEICRVLNTITSGQELDLLRFRDADKTRIVALANANELDDYTYRVAGCVGDFWTRVCVRHLSPKPKIPEDELVSRGIRFGKGLQLVNILRDIPADLKNGRCYLPAPELAAAGLLPADLLLSKNESRARPVYNHWLGLADEHLRAGWQYVLALPASWVRVRLACAWPILIGVQTIDRLRRENPFDASRRIKISRPEVRRIMRASLVAMPFRKRWENLPTGISRATYKVAR